MTPSHLNSCTVAVGHKRLSYGATYYLLANCRINTHTNTHTHTHKRMYTHIQTHTNKHTQNTHTQTHTHKHKHTHKHTHTQTHTHTNTQADISSELINLLFRHLRNERRLKSRENKFTFAILISFTIFQYCLYHTIPPEAWTSLLYECCVLSCRGHCDRPIARPEESYRVYLRVCVCACVPLTVT